MTPTNNKTVHQTSFTPYREQPRSTRIVVAYPRPAFSATNSVEPMPLMIVCVCCLPIYSGYQAWLVDVPAGVTQEEGHTGFLIHLPPAVLALFFSREGFGRSFLSSTVKSIFCVLTNLSFSTPWWAFYFYFFSEEKSQFV